MADDRMNAMTRTAEQGLSEIAGLINKREYNLSLVRARQFMEQVVRGYAERTGIEYTTLADGIEKLYQGRIISRDSRDALHTIRILGNSAVHEGDNDPQNAQKAYYYLKEQLEVFFSYLNRPVNSPDRTPVNISPQYKERSERRRDNDGYGRVPTREDRLRAHKEERTKQKKSKNIGLADILRIVIPIICIILIIIILKNIIGGRKKSDMEETAPVTVEETVPETTEPETTEPEPTEPETTEPAHIRYRVSGNGVNVRYSDDQNRIYTVLDKGTEIGEIEEIEGSDFVKISMDGGSYVISKKFIEPIEE